MTEGSSPAPGGDTGQGAGEPQSEDRWERPAGEQPNTGVPASAPSRDGPWDPPTARGEHWAQPEQVWARPGFGPPDPAAVGGPPWPALVAVGHYVPPRMIRWPIVVGFLSLAVAFVVALAISGSTTISHRAWLAQHGRTIEIINQDVRATITDNPAQGGSASKWIADWETFHKDVAAAASLPNPGGAADAPWRELINDYYNGSSEIVQGVRTANQGLITRALRDLAAGNSAAREFDRAMGLSSS
jgi:hypothetical protein